MENDNILNFIGWDIDELEVRMVEGGKCVGLLEKVCGI